MNTLAVLPLKSAIGIDEFRSSQSEARSWSGMKIFFADRLVKLSAFSVKSLAMAEIGLL